MPAVRIDGVDYVTVGDIAWEVNLPGATSHAPVFSYIEARHFQRCDGCGVMGGVLSDIYLCYFTRLPSGTVVRTTVLDKHHLAGTSCLTSALSAFVKKVEKYDRLQDGVE